jgi:hypothetical protein
VRAGRARQYMTRVTTFLDCHFEREREIPEAIHCLLTREGTGLCQVSGIPRCARNDMWAKLGFIIEHGLKATLSR